MSVNPASYVFPITLRDGTPITLRAPRHDDGPRIRRAFKQLAPETVYTRFFEYKNEVSDAELRRITDADFVRDIALLVTVGSGAEEAVVGGAAAYAIDAATPPRRAELAFTVAEPFQGRGIAGLLVGHILALARGNGIAMLEADVLPGNTRMLSVFRDTRLPMMLRHEGDMVHVVLTLQPET